MTAESKGHVIVLPPYGVSKLRTLYDKPMYYFMLLSNKEHGVGYPQVYETREAAVAARDAFMETIVKKRRNRFLELPNEPQFQVAATEEVLDALVEYEKKEASKKRKKGGGKKATEWSFHVNGEWGNHYESMQKMRKRVNNGAVLNVNLSLAQTQAVKSVAKSVFYNAHELSEATFELILKLQDLITVDERGHATAPDSVYDMMRADAHFDTLVKQKFEQCAPIHCTQEQVRPDEFTCEHTDYL